MVAESGAAVRQMLGKELILGSYLSSRARREKGRSRKMLSCIIWRHWLKEWHTMHLRGLHSQNSVLYNQRQHVTRVEYFSLALTLKIPNGTQI